MQAWKRFGAFIGGHFAIIAPILVISAVIFPDVFSRLLPIVPAMFAVITFQGSLGNDFSSLAGVLRAPKPLLAILATFLIAMPALAWLGGMLLFGDNPNIVTGIVLEYSVPVAVVSIMWIGMYDGDISLGLVALLVSTVLAPITIPLTLKVLLGATVEVDSVGMMRSMVVQIALPALAGTALNHASRGWGKEQLSPILSPAAKLLLMLVILANSTKAAPYMRDLTPERIGVIVFIAVFTALGFLLGTGVARLAGMTRAQTVTTAFQCGLRNISAGAVIASQYFPGEVMLPVIAGTLFQQMFAAFSGTILERVWTRQRS